jgi:hypothetical protein
MHTCSDCSVVLLWHCESGDHACCGCTVMLVLALACGHRSLTSFFAMSNPCWRKPRMSGLYEMLVA